MGGSTILVIVVAAIAAAALGLWAVRRAAAAAARRNASGTQGAQPEQWGVRIEAPDPARACPQVRKLLGKEFALETKPPLPLADCPNASQCACRYVRLYDRRGEPRRSGHDRRTAGQRFEKDKLPRRSGSDRRGNKPDWY